MDERLQSLSSTASHRSPPARPSGDFQQSVDESNGHAPDPTALAESAISVPRGLFVQLTPILRVVALVVGLGSVKMPYTGVGGYCGCGACKIPRRRALLRWTLSGTRYVSLEAGGDSGPWSCGVQCFAVRSLTGKRAG